MDKKEIKEAKDNFALHVLLLIRDGVPRANANALAWFEGPPGLTRRLQGKALLTAPVKQE